ncbi:chromosomal replication initiator protein DnaA [Ruminococcaceae bacterium OttesenSCG-928-A16]|nr:chromosomal replication initiator protein DnaA [Ruminococcaceae bacterium OttesenSCG-928-A16]
MDSFVEIFAAVKEYCKERVAPATYDLFIADLDPLTFENSTACIKVRSDFVKGVLEERYLVMLKDAFKSFFGFDVEIDFVVEEEEKGGESVSASLSGGNYDYTFDNFIVGQNNKFAHAAALSVASNPSRSWNPLFIYGASGLGKTHLLFAIQTEIAKNHPDFKISYIDGDRFTNEIIHAIQEKRMNEFHDKYRTVDVLLVDDIQFIGGKESTQEEFFHTFNTLYNAGKQIVLASDRPPKEIKSLDERLRTRFEWGLTSDIQPPDFETRVAIIRRKASLLNFDIPDEVAEFIAGQLKNNIRQLEGAVKTLNGYYLLEGIQPVIGAAQNAIKDILSETQPLPVTIEKITNEVARTYNVSPEDIKSRKRNANISTARMVAMYCVREITGISMEEIGSEFGNRDHSTVVYACNTITTRLKNDTHMRETVEDIIKNVRS